MKFNVSILLMGALLAIVMADPVPIPTLDDVIVAVKHYVQAPNVHLNPHQIATEIAKLVDVQLKLDYHVAKYQRDALFRKMVTKAFLDAIKSSGAVIGDTHHVMQSTFHSLDAFVRAHEKSTVVEKLSEMIDQVLRNKDEVIKSLLTK